MRFLKIICFPLILVLLLITAYYLQDKKIAQGRNQSVKYELVPDWPKLPKSILLGNPTGIGIDSNEHIFIFHRANRTWPLFGNMPTTYIKEKTILMLDKESGKLLNSWGSNLFIMPHGLTVDHENNIWITDVALHQVFKFSYDGKLLMKLGEAKVPGNDHDHFDKPTDVAIAKDGSFYVSDGYGNSRVIKFSSTGKFLFEWGTKGNKIGEFNIPHGIDLDENENVYIADRENSRIQIFNSTGKFLSQIIDENFGNICAIHVEKESNHIYLTDDLSFLKIKHRGSDIMLIDSNQIQLRFGRSGSYNGSTRWYHDIVVDKDKNIYVGDILGNSIQKFRRVAK